ncbi:MAG: SPOR domain-containing protein [Chlorobi bacterium]|nr:SPOR domain-containing protein [Chlorobiota bacterium]
MLKPAKYIYLFLLTAFLFSCSSSKKAAEETSDNNAEEVYVFDDVGGYGEQTSDANSSNVVANQNIPEETGREYIVQVGAFTSQARAERFVTVNQSKVGFPMQISYSDKVNLYVVQLPPFPTRKDAENVRDNLWTIDTFRDAFIVTK